MKKFLFVLTVLAALLLCGSVALAAGHPCDMCGGSTTLEGVGAWCHWYCEKCDYTTSRNHDPNSYYSGLEPDSCSGYCRWCGSAANYSSHTFTTWVYDGNATCTADGTETAKCDNVQCWATNTRTSPGTALGHDYSTQVVPPTCQEEGYTIYTCTRCGDTYNDDITSATGHNYANWVYNGDGTHTANCANRNCYHHRTADCTSVTTVVGGKKLTLCPVCGNVTFDLNEHPFQMESSAFSDMLPAEMNARAFKIVRVEYKMIEEKLTEVWYEMPFTLEKGVLTFETDKMGTFLMVLKITNPPVAK